MSLSSKPHSLQTIALGVFAGMACCIPATQADPIPAHNEQSNAAAIAAAEDRVAGGTLSEKTDTELTELTAQWANLSPGERRALLAEVTGRMAANHKARAKMGVSVQRRYGRVVRKSDGSVVVQTRVVQMRPKSSSPADSPSTAAGSTAAPVRGRVTFGIGFEQRSRSSGSPQQQSVDTQSQSSPPAVTVSQPSTADQTQ